MGDFPYYRQTEIVDCGPACIKMICLYFGVDSSIESIKSNCNITATGTSLYHLEQASKSSGLDCIATKLTIDELLNTVELPCILHFSQSHYVVVPPQASIKEKIIIYDPNYTGITTMAIDQFIKKWVGKNIEQVGYALIFGNK